MSNRHFSLDEEPSPPTQPCQDRTACDFSQPNTFHTSQFLHPARRINHNTFQDNLGVVTDDQLILTDHTAKTAQSCRFALYNIRKIRPFLSEHTTPCSSTCSAQALQLIQNAAATVVFFNEPKRVHVTPLFINLHWLPTAACMKFMVLMFAYKTTTGPAPLYLNSLLQTYVSSTSLFIYTVCIYIYI